MSLEEATRNVEVARARYERRVQAWRKEFEALCLRGRHELLTALKEAALVRDGPNCHYCGVATVRQPLNPPKGWDRRRDTTIDHRVPASKGGADSLENIVIACRSCNSAKGNRAWFAIPTPRPASTVAPPQAMPAGDMIATKPGSKVTHPVFGEGIVVSSAPKAGDVEVVVAFIGKGMKRLSTRFAKLQSVEET